MVEGMAFKTEPERRLPPSGNWRVVISAWVIAILALLLLAGYQAVSSRHEISPPAETLVGTVIPQHDPGCSGPRVPDPTSGEECRALGAPFGQTPGAYVYSGW